MCRGCRRPVSGWRSWPSSASSRLPRSGRCGTTSRSVCISCSGSPRSACSFTAPRGRRVGPSPPSSSRPPRSISSHCLPSPTQNRRVDLDAVLHSGTPAGCASVYRGRTDLITNVYHLGPTATLYPYMPLTLVAFAPAYALFGDYRVLSALCVPATVALNRATGRRLDLDSRFIDATTLAFLLLPRGTWLTCFGWTEPLLVVVLSGFVYLATRAPGGAAQAIAFLFCPRSSSTSSRPCCCFWRSAAARVSRRRCVTVAAATVVPFLIWDWRPTIEGILVQMVSPVQPRLDSTSLVALVGVTDRRSCDTLGQRRGPVPRGRDGLCTAAGSRPGWASSRVLARTVRDLPDRLAGLHELLLSGRPRCCCSPPWCSPPLDPPRLPRQRNAPASRARSDRDSSPASRGRRAFRRPASRG